MKKISTVQVFGNDIVKEQQLTIRTATKSWA